MSPRSRRFARSHVSELTTTIFHLGDEDIKGKIIGREGRNIRAFEQATGVDVDLDEEGIIRWNYLSTVGMNPGADGILNALEELDKQKSTL